MKRTEFRSEFGFARVDLLFTMATAALVVTVTAGTFAMSSSASRLNICKRNLAQVGRACLQYATDHNGTLPGPSRDLPEGHEFWWFYKEQVKSYAGIDRASSAEDKVFACPMDRGYSEPKAFYKQAKYDYGSYNFNGVTLLGSPNIAGWKTSGIQLPKRTLLVMEWTAHAPLSWHRSRTGRANAPFYVDAESVVAFADGSVAMIPIYYDGYNAAYTRDPIPGYAYKYSGR